MAAQHRSTSPPRTKGKSPQERSVEYDAQQARLKAEAAARREGREERAAPAPDKRAADR